MIYTPMDQIKECLIKYHATPRRTRPYVYIRMGADKDEFIERCSVYINDLFKHMTGITLIAGGRILLTRLMNDYNYFIDDYDEGCFCLVELIAITRSCSVSSNVKWKKRGMQLEYDNILESTDVCPAILLRPYEVAHIEGLKNMLLPGMYCNDKKYIDKVWIDNDNSLLMAKEIDFDYKIHVNIQMSGELISHCYLNPFALEESRGKYAVSYAKPYKVTDQVIGELMDELQYVIQYWGEDCLERVINGEFDDWYAIRLACALDQIGEYTNVIDYNMREDALRYKQYKTAHLRLKRIGRKGVIEEVDKTMSELHKIYFNGTST